MGCLILIMLAVAIWVWYLIFKYIGHTPISSVSYEFPDHYVRNWFGDIWIYSFIWLPILIFLIILVKQNWKVIKGKANLHKRKLMKISLYGVLATSIISTVTLWFVHEHQKTEEINQLLDEQIEEHFNALPDFGYSKIDLKNNQIDVYFKGNFDWLRSEEQYIVLDNIREYYVKLVQNKEYKNIDDKQKITVNAMFTTYGGIASLKNDQLTNRMDESIKESEVDFENTDPIASIKRWEKASNAVNGVSDSSKYYSDSSCEKGTRDNSSARSHCVKMLIIEKCSQYMGSHMKNGQHVNWGQKSQPEKLEACVKEHISPENLPFNYK